MLDAHRVGAALAYLVQRMETFCGVSGSDVLLYKPGDLGGIPRRMPAADVLGAQAKHYLTHRHRYPEVHQGVLDAHLSAIRDPLALPVAIDGFTSTLANQSSRRTNP